jgi:hypothetical protein
MRRSSGYVYYTSLMRLELTEADPIRRRWNADANHRHFVVNVGAAGITGGYEEVPRGTGDQGIAICRKPDYQLDRRTGPLSTGHWQQLCPCGALLFCTDGVPCTSSSEDYIFRYRRAVQDNLSNAPYSRPIPVYVSVLPGQSRFTLASAF